MTANPQLMVGAVVFKISVLQNEKEEALTTSVWLELVVKHHQTLIYYNAYRLNRFCVKPKVFLHVAMV